jgi:hypothetical protein
MHHTQHACLHIGLSVVVGAKFRDCKQGTTVLPTLFMSLPMFYSFGFPTGMNLGDHNSWHFPDRDSSSRADIAASLSSCEAARYHEALNPNSCTSCLTAECVLSSSSTLGKGRMTTIAHLTPQVTDAVADDIVSNCRLASNKNVLKKADELQSDYGIPHPGSQPQQDYESSSFTADLIRNLMLTAVPGALDLLDFEAAALSSDKNV